MGKNDVEKEETGEETKENQGRKRTQKTSNFPKLASLRHVSPNISQVFQFPTKSLDSRKNLVFLPKQTS